MGIHRPLFTKNLKTKLIFIFAIAFLYLLFVAVFFGYGSYRKLLKDKSLNYSRKNAEGMAVILDERIENLNNFARTILYDDRIYSFNREIILSEQDPFFQYKFASDVETYLRSILFSKDEFMSVGFKFKQKKTPFISSRIYTMNEQMLMDMNRLYEEGKKGRGKPVWYVTTDSNGHKVIYVAKLVYDMNALNEIGMYIFRVDPEMLYDVLGKLGTNVDNNIYVFDQREHLLYSSIHFSPSISDFVQKLCVLKPSETFVPFKAKFDTIYANSSSISNGAFRMVVCISSKSILKEVNNQSSFFILLFLLIIPVLAILVNYFLVDILKPLNTLVGKMKSIEKGDMGVTIETKRSDEFGYVFKTFNKMSQQIKVLIDSVYREQIALKEEEIKALQAQINPHFLYNTLEAINFKARINKVPEISEMVTSLSYIMEANMNRNNEKFITVAKEIEYIENYRLIIEKRFNDKLRISIHVPEELMECIVPKLIILPMIENSVYHGLEMKKGIGIIELGMEHVGEDLVMTVIDNGLGMEQDVLDRIHSYLDIDIDNLDDREQKKVTNIGLINVHKRLKLLYGNEYGIEISSIAIEGTTVRIKMPYQV